MGIFDNGSYLGGIIGKLTGNTLHISLLGVEEKFRGKGYGDLLVNEAQKIAKERACQYITVNTQEYQGLSFYQKIGLQ